MLYQDVDGRETTRQGKQNILREIHNKIILEHNYKLQKEWNIWRFYVTDACGEINYRVTLDRKEARAVRCLIRKRRERILQKNVDRCNSRLY